MDENIKLSKKITSIMFHIMLYNNIYYIMTTNNKFYVGSCRYQRFFNNIFPPRLHTTKEVIQFLNNYDNIDIDNKYANFMYGSAKIQ